MLGTILSFFGLAGGDSGIYQTVGYIKQAIAFALREPKQRIRRRAEDLIRAGARERNEGDEVTILFGWVQDHFHFVQDPQNLEYVKSPEVSDDEITLNGVFLGDCDDATAYLAALLKSIGYEVRLVIIAPANAPDASFRHIYLDVLIRLVKNPFYVPLDVTAKGRPIGWAPPNQRISTYPV